jgi:hypothetical protein
MLAASSSGIGPCSHWLTDCANCTPTPEENDKYSANHSQCNTGKSSKPINLSMHNYTPLVISGNDKNKQLTLLSQHKLALAAINTFTFCTMKPSEPLKKFKNQPRPLLSLVL